VFVCVCVCVCVFVCLCLHMYVCVEVFKLVSSHNSSTTSKTSIISEVGPYLLLLVTDSLHPLEY
jgi:hypothetical protein